MKSLVLIFLLVTVTVFSCELKDEMFVDFDPAAFISIETCDWFILKNAYYSAKNADSPDSTKVDQLTQALQRLGDFRGEIIFEMIRSVFGKKCNWRSDTYVLSRKALSIQSKFAGYFGGHTEYLECEDAVYILNSFGSSTVTSDFDYSVLKVTKNSLLMSHLDNLANIKEITMKLYQMDYRISQKYCGGQSTSECLDTNGYPDIMVFYLTAFRYSTMFHNIQKAKERYSNVFSAQILRFCVVSQVYFKKLENMNLDFLEIKSQNLVNICFKTIYQSILEYRGHFGLTMNFDRAERKVDPYILEDPENATKEQKDEVEAKNSSLFNPENYTLAMTHLNNLVKYIAKKEDFEECISHVDAPNYFISKMGVDLGEQRKVSINYMSRRVDYIVVDDLFYIPNNYGVNHGDRVNRLLLPFLGGCHFYASEAYVTFGALEYVKFEKMALRGERTLRCSTYIESLIENFGILIFHLTEYIADGDFDDFQVEKNQVISDTFSKYLRRALLAHEFPCKNDFDQKVSGFFVKTDEFAKIVEMDLFKFYMEIRDVDQSLTDKKELYFEIFKKYYSGFQLSELIKHTLEFYKTFYYFMFSNYNLEELYFMDSIEKKKVQSTDMRII